MKILGSQSLPWALQFSGTYQFSQGPNILANWAVPNSVIAPALGRNLAAGMTATKTVNLVETGTRYGQSLNQLDMRLSKRFDFESHRFRASACAGS